MRTLAARLGLCASSLYRHFPDRSSIERSLANRAADQLLDCMKSAVKDATGDTALLHAAGAYLLYASSEVSFYDVLMRAGLPIEGHSDATKGIWDLFVTLVSSATGFEPDESGAAALWSFLHGFAILSRTGQFGQINQAQTSARGTLALVRGLSLANADAFASGA
jgi:AcrR family transcriptional regulator